VFNSEDVSYLQNLVVSGFPPSFQLEQAVRADISMDSIINMRDVFLLGMINVNALHFVQALSVRPVSRAAGTCQLEFFCCAGQL